jgi:hypothetical protein
MECGDWFKGNVLLASVNYLVLLGVLRSLPVSSLLEHIHDVMFLF